MVVGWRSITLYYYCMMNLHGWRLEVYLTLYYYCMMNLHGCRLEVYNSILLLHDESAWLEVGVGLDVCSPANFP